MTKESISSHVEYSTVDPLIYEAPDLRQIWCMYVENRLTKGPI